MVVQLVCSEWAIKIEEEEYKGFMSRLNSEKTIELPWLTSNLDIESKFEVRDSYSKALVLISVVLLETIFNNFRDPVGKGNMSRVCKLWAKMFYLKKWQYDITLTRITNYRRLVVCRTTSNQVLRVISKRYLCHTTSNLFARYVSHTLQSFACPMVDEDLEEVTHHLSIVNGSYDPAFPTGEVLSEASNIVFLIVFRLDDQK